MKRIKILFIAVVAAIAMAAPASAQFRFGITGGLTINELNFKDATATSIKDQLEDTGNHSGYTVGITSEFTVPIIGIGGDASVLYTHRVLGYQTDSDKKFNTDADLIEIPIHLRYKLSLPAIGSIVSPLIFTGPSFGFRVSDEIAEELKTKSCQVLWDLGLGVELFKHLQVTAKYSWGINDFVEH
ncbi:MAG: PorT family protein, partial [Muribaculaceae bacterium]|nr:PorT family protein [Muribaculaceae bacterium]